jgi:hypothetical protein
MTRRFSKGAKLSWTWGAHETHGQVVESFTADFFKQDDGDQVLKSHPELRPH